MSSTPFTAGFNKLVQDSLDRWHVPGFSISVVHGDDSWSKCYGIAQQPSAPVTPTTLFYAASTTKAQLGAVWALYIASEANTSKPKDEQISFSTPLSRIIRDDFVLSDPVYIENVTLEDALSHRTGMPAHESSYGFEGTKTVKDITRNLRHLPLHNPLRAKFQYCNTMYIAASYALEVVTGKPMNRILREGLWEPLGMKQTYAGLGEASDACKDTGDLIAQGHTWSKLLCEPDEKDGGLVKEPYLDLREISGAGYVFTTADDYIKWMRCFLQPSTGPLTEDIIKELRTPRSIVPADEIASVPFDGIMTYSLGWCITMYKGHIMYWHLGSVVGAGSFVVLVPDLKWGVSYFANGDNGGSKMEGVAMELLDDVLGIPPDARYTRKRQEEEIIREHQSISDGFARARNRLYPTAPTTPNVPLTLPTGQYAGAYTNVAYGSLTFKVSKDGDGKDCLVCKIEDRTWPRLWILQHVNAECWFMIRSVTHSPVKQGSRAESQLGADGKVKAFGIAVEPSMPETLMWFERQ